MEDAKLEALARDGIERFNESDWSGLRSMLADDIVYEETGAGVRVEGADALVDGLAGWKSAFPDLRGEVVRAVSSGTTVVLEVRWRGTHEGPLPTPAGVVPPSGAAVETTSTFWQEFRDGLLVEERNHLDLLTLLTQIGALGR